MRLRARFRPHPRGFGLLTPVAEDDVSPRALQATDPQGARVEVDRVFVPPPLARGLVADDLVTVTAELDDRGATTEELELVHRPRRMLVGRVQRGPGRLVLEPDPTLGTGWVRLDESLAPRLDTSEGRQIIVLIADGEDGAPLGRALVAGPYVVGSPQAVRAGAVVVALGRAAPSLVPGGAGAAGLEPTEAETAHTRLIGQLAGGGRGGAAGLDAFGEVPAVDLEPVERRDEPCVTIDDESARDLDDAVGASWTGQPDDPVRVAVHIADVAASVGRDSPADRYARTVATSAYPVVGDSAPMLDPALSEDACSLLVDTDRRAISVRFSVAADGAIDDVRIETAVIGSWAQLSYRALESWLDGDAAEIREQAGKGADTVEELLRAAMEAARRLGVERDARQTFEELFDDAELEPAIVDGRLATVAAEPHARAYRLVERLMVAANETVAGWLAAHDVPALYRTHTGVDPARLERLRAAVELADVEVASLREPEPDPGALTTELLARIDELTSAGRLEDRDLLVAASTTSTARANYDPDPSHHRGLAASAYTHFTSPIRRYADLVVHRQIRAVLGGEKPPLLVADLAALAPWLDARAGAMGHLQARERAQLWARLLERGFPGGADTAVVTGVTGAGLRVRLPRLGLTGFVPAERALGLGPRERGRLEVDEHGLTTTSGPWRLGSRVTVAYDGLDALGEATWRLAAR